MNAFLTGSYAYGTPNKSSDLDLVLRTDDLRLVELLKKFSAMEGIIRYGKLNIIVCTDDKEYLAWRCGTESALSLNSPMNKEAARREFNKVRTMLGVEDNY